MPSKNKEKTSKRLTLKDIEKHLKDIKRSTMITWNIGFGVTAMVIAYTWLNDTPTENDFSAIVIGALGLLLVGLAACAGYSWLISFLWRKWRSKPDEK
ncbi:MAG: hypothetical protein OEZ00_03660 [Dehalococcoidia bacterium]|nr:hypothetical protein [Dehalococcoidia bacterium]